jgi:hypothetical protein
MGGSMTKLAWLAATVVSGSLLACTTPADESIGSDQAEICYFGHAPPAGFTADVVRSLDGDGNWLITDGYSGPSDCDFYTMDLDTSPDRARSVDVRIETLGDCEEVNADDQAAFMWKRLGSGATATWSFDPIPLESTSWGALGFCSWYGVSDLGDNEYTRIILAAKGRNPNGTPAAPELRAYDVPSDSGNLNEVFPPVLCPVVGTTPPTADSSKSLDGSATFAQYSAMSTASGCDFVTMSVDTDPDRAKGWAYIDIFTDTCDEVDLDSMELYIWKRLGTGPWYSWSRERVNGGNTWGGWPHNTYPNLCPTFGRVYLPSGNDYTRIVLAGRALTDAGDPVRIQLTLSE